MEGIWTYISFAVSVIYILLFGSLADILLPGPASAGKNMEWINAGFWNLRRGAVSLARRKYGS